MIYTVWNLAKCILQLHESWLTPLNAIFSSGNRKQVAKHLTWWGAKLWTGDFFLARHSCTEKWSGTCTVIMKKPATKQPSTISPNRSFLLRTFLRCYKMIQFAGLLSFLTEQEHHAQLHQCSKKQWACPSHLSQSVLPFFFRWVGGIHMMGSSMDMPVVWFLGPTCQTTSHHLWLLRRNPEFEAFLDSPSTQRHGLFFFHYSLFVGKYSIKDLQHVTCTTDWYLQEVHHYDGSDFVVSAATKHSP